MADKSINEEASTRASLRRAAPFVFLFAIAIAMTAVHMVRYDTLSPIDELRHVDYAMRITDGELVKLGDRLGQESIEAEACHGADVPEPDPPCGRDHYNPRAFRDDGYQTASAHPPTYYLTVGLVARAAVAVGIAHDFVDPARLMGGVLLGLGLVFTYLAGIRLGVRKGPLLAALTLIPTASAVIHATSTVNPDSASILAGAVVLWAAVAWEQGRIPLLALAGAGALATAIKYTNLLAVLAVAAWLLVRSPQGERVLDRIQSRWRGRFGDDAGEPSATPSKRTATATATTADAGAQTATAVRDTFVRAAVYLVGGAVVVAAVWSFIDRARATIDPLVVPQNQILRAHGLPSLGLIFGSNSGLLAHPTMFTWFPPVDGYDSGHFYNVAVFNAQVIAFVLLAGAMLMACVRVNRREPIFQLGAVTTLFAIFGAPAFLLMNYFVSNVISPPNGRYGMSLLPIFAIVLASWIRQRSTTVLLALFAFAVYATEWGTIALADSVKPH